MVAIIDYGAGNLMSVKKALDFIGAKSSVTADKDEIKNASHVILPGVGSFGDAMAAMERSALTQTVKEAALSGKSGLLYRLRKRAALHRRHSVSERADTGQNNVRRVFYFVFVGSNTALRAYEIKRFFNAHKISRAVIDYRNHNKQLRNKIKLILPQGKKYYNTDN